MQKLTPEPFIQEGKQIESRFKIRLPKQLRLSSEYEGLPVEWRVLGSVKLKKGPKSVFLFTLPLEVKDRIEKVGDKNLN